VDVLLTRRDGRSTGEAYVLFGTPMQVCWLLLRLHFCTALCPLTRLPSTKQMDYALQKNRQSMGRRYIEVFRSKKGDYYAAVASHVADPGLATVAAAPPGTMGAGQAVPLHAQAAAYNANHSAHPLTVPLSEAAAGDGQQQPGDGQPASSADVGGAAAGGGAPVASGSSPPAGDESSLAASLGATGLRDARAVRPDASVAAAHTGVLKLRGLPFSASKDDIITFFGDPSLGLTPLVHDSIHIVTSLDGRPSGVAFAEFSCAEDARLAMRKDRGSMGNRYVELFASSREEATRAATAAR
jgi:heterogeneous nuclear ribonucleoprotein F/H